ncbi:MAG: MerR family transcriptional regulator, partial [Ruminococcaceae bacterium]|nr:MerR family transcriptional regulator [Oscillospiraceae bacterium]
MEYTINKMARLAGISTRTLRYYDEIGLLTPTRNHKNGYRLYGRNEVDKLQQILFFRELDVPLEEIGKMLQANDFDELTALQNHMISLL